MVVVFPLLPVMAITLLLPIYLNANSISLMIEIFWALIFLTIAAFSGIPGLLIISEAVDEFI